MNWIHTPSLGTSIRIHSRTSSSSVQLVRSIKDVISWTAAAESIFAEGVEESEPVAGFVDGGCAQIVGWSFAAGHAACKVYAAVEDALFWGGEGFGEVAEAEEAVWEFAGQYSVLFARGRIENTHFQDHSKSTS